MHLLGLEVAKEQAEEVVISAAHNNQVLDRISWVV
jgi:hypothetical protein